MKNKELFDKTIAILVKAYFEGQLIKGDYCACAVGNLIVANCGYKIIDNPNADEDGIKLAWDKAVAESWFEQLIWTDESPSISITVKNQVKKTGYKVHEIIGIENAFESGKDNYEGLMLICEYLMEIHECSIEETQSAKLMFAPLI